jgi:hypothetical protein
MSEIATTSSVQPKQKYSFPSSTTMSYVFKLSIVEDKPIMMDYWVASLDKTASIGVRDNNESLLVKSEEEFTSPIAKKYKSGTEFILITENSIYVVSVDIPHKRIA